MSWEQIRASLVERGLWTEDGVSRRARARYCRRCGGVVMAGLDHDRVAAVAYCDPAPVNAMGEAMALLAGRATYSLRYLAGAYSLDYRYAEMIAANPAGSQFDVEVLAAHKCGAPFLAAQLRGPLMQKRTTPRKALDDTPPF